VEQRHLCGEKEAREVQKGFEMRVRWYLVIALLLGVILLVPVGCFLTQASGFTKEQSREIAEDYLRNDPTFRFDGIAGSIKLVETNRPGGTYCWEFVFEFECLHAGYGDRSGEVVAQVITPHSARIVVMAGEVVSAVMDGKWDMVNQRMIE